MTSLWTADRPSRELKQARRSYSDAISRMRVTFPTRDSASVPNALLLTIECLRGIGYAAWQEIDERSGYRDLEDWRFVLVRQARNSPFYGRLLIEAINEPATLTLAYVRHELRNIGLRFKKTEAGDYRIRFPEDQGDEGYFTSDLRDALDTGRVMVATRRHQDAEQQP